MGTLTFKNRDPMLLKQTGRVPLKMDLGTLDFLGPYFQRLGYHPNLKFTQRMSIQSAYIQQWEKCLLTSSVLHLSNLNFYSCSCVKFHWIWVPILCTRGPHFIKMWVDQLKSWRVDQLSNVKLAMIKISDPWVQEWRPWEGSVDQLDIGKSDINDTEVKLVLNTVHNFKGDLKHSKWGPQTFKIGTQCFWSKLVESL